jgi:hypothetical protein
MPTKAKARTCPECQRSVVPIPIVHGFPSPESFEDAEAGRVQLGGRIVTDDDPEWACPNCEVGLFDDDDHKRRYQRWAGDPEFP